MFDLNEVDETELVLLPKIQGTNEIEARKILTKSLTEIGKLKPEAWELEKLAIVEADIISESKLEKIRKLATRDGVVLDDDEQRAKEKLGRVFCSTSGKGYAYLILEGKDLRAIPQQEMSPLVKMLAGDDPLKESEIYELLHSKRRIDKTTTHIMPHGQSHYEMEKLENGGFEAVCHVSLGETLKNQLRKCKGYEVDPKFEKMVKKNYQYMIDVYEYALALKFAFDKTNCIWLREHSDTGKTFFLGALEAKDYVFITDGAIKENDFIGDGPERWGKMLYFYIDEATKFSSEMKTAYLAYRMNYGGRVELDMPLRILASDNEITDLTGGVDRQIENRIINIHYQGKMNLRKWLDDNDLDATTAQIMWQKIILTHILELVESWSKSNNLQEAASKKIVEFKKLYKKGEMVGLDLTAKDLLDTFLADSCDEEGRIRAPDTRTQTDYREFIFHDEGCYYIKRPKAFFMLLFEAYMPEKRKAFFKKYPNNDAIAKVFDSEYKNRRFAQHMGRSVAVTVTKK